MRDRYKVALLMFGVGWGANHFSALLLVYRDAGYSAGVVTAMYGVYAVGLVPALALAGPLSDRFGRRRVFWPAVALSALASAVLLVGASAGSLIFAGRILAGVATGAAMASGTAWVRQLSRGSGAGVAAVSLSAGFGGGPLVSGVIAQWLPGPMILPYMAHIILLAGLTALAFRAEEPPVIRVAGTSTTEVKSWGSHRLISVAFILGVGLWAPWVFGSPSISFATIPSLPGVQEVFHSAPIFTGGLIAGITLFTGIAVQPVALRFNRANRTAATITGLILAAIGLLGAALVAWPDQHLGWWAPFIVSGAFGAAYGFLMVSGLVEVEHMAPLHRHGTFVAVYYALTYVGFGIPYLLTLLGEFQPTSAWLLAGAGVVVLLIPIKAKVGHVPTRE